MKAAGRAHGPLGTRPRARHNPEPPLGEETEVGPLYDALGPKDSSPAPKQLPFWRYDGPGHWHPGTRPVRVANSLEWSPDGCTVYFSDTPTKTLWEADYDPTRGEMTRERVFARFDEGTGPDGAAMDQEGYLWCALHGAGKLVRLDPHGRLDLELPLPVRYPTKPAFGGEDLRTLYLTSANGQLSEEERRQRPEEGNLFALDVEVPGFARPAWRVPGT
jgi:sugar lactone lactonase YvrE